MKFRIFQPQAIHERGSRPNQEDSIFPVINTATPNDRLFILCDGMGGHESGEVASGTVCQTISDYILSRLAPDQPLDDALFEEALNAAYAAVDAHDTSGQKKMGTTLTFICFHKGGCTVAHIGDSRIYHLRPSTNEILYRSRDHSLVYDLFEVGEMTYEELKTAKNKNVITRVIMAHQERQSKADIVHITNIKPGDYFYLCSDGMLEQMDDQELMEIFSSDRTDEQKRKVLVGQTIDNSDNHSAYILHIESVEAEVGDEMLFDDEEQAREANKILMAELNPASVAAVTAPLPPPPPPAPEFNEVNQVNEVNQGFSQPEDDVQVVMSQPVPPQPEYHAAPQSYAQPQQQKSNGMMKWGILGALICGIIAAVVVILFILNNKEDKPEAITIPTEQPVTTPVRTNTSSFDDDDDDDDRPSQYRRQQNLRPQKPVSGHTTTQSTNASGRRNHVVTTNQANAIHDGKIGSSNGGGNHDGKLNSSHSGNTPTGSGSAGSGSSGSGSSGSGSGSGSVSGGPGKLNPDFE